LHRNVSQLTDEEVEREQKQDAERREAVDSQSKTILSQCFP
jgi:hypothetical protein